MATTQVDRPIGPPEDGVSGDHAEFSANLTRPASAFTRLRAVLPWASYWIIMSISIGSTIWLAQPGHLPKYVWYVMAQVNVILILFFEELIPARRSDRVFQDKQSWNDIGHMLLFKLGVRPLVWMLALLIVTTVGPKLHLGAGIWPDRLPVTLQFVLLLLVFDLIGYWYHRTLHRFDFLYTFHALHHDTPRMHVLKSNRLHIGEEVVNFLLLVPFLLLIGCPPTMTIWLGMWEVFEGNLAHSNVHQKFPHWFHYVARSADLHYIHHSTVCDQQNSNYAEWPIWDIVFRTYKHPAHTQVLKIGLEGYPTPSNFFSQIFFPFKEGFTQVRRACGRKNASQL